MFSITIILFLVIFGTKSVTSKECTKVDLVVVVDSYSGVENVFNEYKNVIIDLVRDLSLGPERTQLALVVYNQSIPVVKHSFDQLQNNKSINAALADLSYDKMSVTNSSQALNVGMKLWIRGRWDAMKVIVIMTDGNSNESWSGLVDASDKLHKSLAQVFIVALGNNTRETNLKRLAGPGALITSENLESFKNEIKSITGNCTNDGSLSTVAVTARSSTFRTFTNCPTAPIIRPVVLSFKCPPAAPCSPLQCPPAVGCTNSIEGAKILAPEGLTAQKKFIIQQSRQILTSQADTAPGPPSATPPAVKHSTVRRADLGNHTTVSKRVTKTRITLSSKSTTQQISKNTEQLIKICGPADILFVIDASGNQEKIFKNQLAIILDLLNDLKIDSAHQQVALILHSGDKKQMLMFSFTVFTSVEKLKSTVKSLPFLPGSSAPGPSLKLAKKLLAERRFNVPAIIVLFTDGLSNDESVSVADNIRSESKVIIYSVGISELVSRQQLGLIAGNESRVFTQDNIDKFKTLFFGEMKNCTMEPLNLGSQTSSSVPTTVESSTLVTQALPLIKGVPITNIKPGSFHFPVVVKNELSNDISNPNTTLTTINLFTRASPSNTTVFTSVQTSTTVANRAIPLNLNAVAGLSSPKAPTIEPETRSDIPSSLAATISTTKPSENAAGISPAKLLTATIPNTTDTVFQSQPSIATTLFNLGLQRKNISLDILSSRDSVPAKSANEPVIKPIDTIDKISIVEVVTNPKQITNCFFDLMFIIDASGSVENVFKKELKMSADIVDRLVIGPNHARIAMIKFAGPGKTKIVLSFDKYNTTNEIKNEILSTGFISGTTSTNEALDVASNEYDVRKGARVGLAPFICIIFTDGYSQLDTKESSQKLKNKGATIFAVAFDKDEPINKNELISIAGHSSNVFIDENMNRFHLLLDKIEQSCKIGTSVSFNV